MPSPYPTLSSPVANQRAIAAHLTDKIYAAIAAPRGLIAAPVTRTSQLLGCTETYLSPLTFTFTIPAQYGNRNLLATLTAHGIMSSTDYVQYWINRVAGASLPTLGGANRVRANNIMSQAAGGESGDYGVCRTWDINVAPGQWTWSVSGLAVGTNCATSGPYADATTNRMWFAIEDKGAA